MGEDVHDDAYKVLQVDPYAEREVIEAAYRRLARKYHPDVNQAPGAAVQMKRLSAAYEQLKDPARRAEYDRRRAGWWRWPWRRRQTPRSQPSGEVRAEAPGSWADRPSCWHHGALPAVDACRACGATLCTWCASPFQPAGCAPCVLQRAQRVQRRAALGTAIFAVVFVAALMAARAVAARPPRALLIAYLIAATALGIAVLAGRMWRSGWQDEPRDGGLGVAFLVWVGLMVGWMGAPLLLGKLALDFRRARRLADSARTALQAT